MVSKVVSSFLLVAVLFFISYSKAEPIPTYRRYFVNDYDETYVFGLSDDDRRNFHQHRTTERPQKSSTIIATEFKGTVVTQLTKPTTKAYKPTKPPQSPRTSFFDIFRDKFFKSTGNEPNYMYMGCYDTWNSNNMTASKPFYDATNTPGECTTKCKTNNYQMAFLKGTICICSHAAYFRMIRVPDFYCDIRCSSDAQPQNNAGSNDNTEELFCGGNFVYSVYCTEGDIDCSTLIKPFHPIDLYRPTQRPPVDDSNYYQDPEEEDGEQDFSIGGMRYISCAHCTQFNCARTSYSPHWDYMPNNSPETCIAYCKRPVLYLKDNEIMVRNATKYAILALDYTKTTSDFLDPNPVCSCKDNVTDLEGLEADSELCDIPCPGNPNTVCGGNGFLTVYCTESNCELPDNDLDPTTTAAPNTTTTPSNPTTTTEDPTTATTEAPTTTESLPPSTTEDSTTTTTEDSTTTTTEDPATTTTEDLATTTTEDPTTEGTVEPETTTTDPTDGNTPPPETTTTTTTEPTTTTTEEKTTTKVPTSTTVSGDTTTGTTKTTTIIAPSSTKRPTVPADCKKCRKPDNRGNIWEGCAGQLVENPCPGSNSSQAMATWFCQQDGEFNSALPDYSNCRTGWVERLNETLGKIDHLDDAEEFLVQVDKLCKEAKENSGTREKYFGHEIENIVHILEVVGNKSLEYSNSTHEYQTIVEKVVNIIDVLFAFNDPWIELDRPSKSKASNQIINLIEKTIFDLTSKVEVGDQFATMLNGTDTDISITGASIPKTKDDNGNIVYTSKDGSTMTLPPGWQKIVKGDQIHLIYMFLDTKIVRRTMPGQYDLIGGSEKDVPGGKLINGKMMSCTIGNNQNVARSQPIHFEGKGVEITFRHDVDAWGEETKEIKRKLHNGEEAKAVLGSAQCIFWDTSKLMWSTDGCKVIASDRYSTTCECEHLTSFAILMDTHKYVGKDLGLEILTLILCPLSIICLVISIVIFTTVRSIQNPRTAITKHLSICLLIGITLVLLVVDRNYFNMNDGMCIASGIISHYIFLCAFLWMAIEGLHLYKMVVHVFDSANDYTKMYSVVAYGLPILIVAITVATGYLRGHEPYGGDIYCWLDGSYIWSFLAPVSLVVAGNLIVLFITLKTAYQLQNNNIMQSRVRSYRTWLRGCFSVTVLLGVTWMIGFFILTDSVIAGVVAGYFFTLLNASQGIFLFVFHCLLNEKVRAVVERTVPLPSWLSSSSLGPSQSFMGKTTASNTRSFDSGGSKNLDFPFRVSSISSRPDGMGMDTKVVRRGSFQRSLGSLSSTAESRRTSDTGSTTDGSQNCLMPPKKSQIISSSC